MDIDWAVFGIGAGVSIIIGIAWGIYEDRKRRRARQKEADEIISKGGRLAIVPTPEGPVLAVVYPDKEE